MYKRQKQESSSSLPDIISKKTVSRKKRLAVATTMAQESLSTKTHPVPTTVVSESSVMGSVTCTTTATDITYTASTWSYDTELASGERRGFGYSVENKQNTSVPLKKGIQFVKAETMMPKSETVLPEKEETILPDKTDAGKIFVFYAKLKNLF